MAQRLQIEWQEDEATLKQQYMEEKDAQNRTKLQALWQLRRGRTVAEVAEMIVIEGWPVQFLPVYDALTEEALARAIEAEFGSTPARVLSAEHLAVIMLETGRPKDHARLLQFFEFDALDRAALEDIVARHGLTARWESFRRRFSSENG